MAEIIQKDILDIQKDNMLEYYMSVMYDRAISDIRDGCKPVQRRILWSMFDETKALSSQPFKKAARCSSNALLYHPHGDSSVYDAMIRLSQSFVQNIVLVDAHGANGSIDGSGAAAARYLECRLSKFTDNEIMKDIYNKAVDFVPNFDGLNKEPVVLPVPTCLALINPSIGIAGGFSQSIPAHNINDIGKIIIELIDNPDLKVSDIAKKLVPDFPTGGILCSKKDIESAYITGKGNVRLRGRAEIVNNKNGTSEIVITEIPYGVTIGPKISSTTTNVEGGLINSIVKKIKDGTIVGIKDIQDLSKKDLEIRIFIKQGFDPTVILNQLYKFTLFEITFKIILVCKNGNYFKQYNIKDIFTEWIEFRIETIERVIINSITKAKHRDHILDGLIIALNNIDEVVKIIKSSKNKAIAKEKLQTKFKLTELQSTSILDMRLSALTSLEMNKLVDEKKELEKQIKSLMESLKPENIKTRIKNEQLELIKKYGRKRLTTVEEINTDLTTEDVIAKEDALVIITNDNTIKRIKPEFKIQKRNTQGINIGDNCITQIFNTNTKDHILCFTNTGRVYDLKVYEIPETASIKTKGKRVENYLALAENEKVTNILCINDNQINDAESYLVFLTKKSYIKRTKLEYFANIRKSGLIALMLTPEDELCDVKYIDISKKMQDLIIITKLGQAVRYNYTEIPDLKRDTKGATAIDLAEGDEIVNFDIIENNKQELFISTINGLAKTVKVTDKVIKKDPNTKQDVEIDDGFPRLKRSSNIKGRKCIKLNDNDFVSSILVKSVEDNHVIAITDKKIVAIDITEFTPLKRVTKGKLLISLTENDKLRKII